jgi:hypothetical protein
MGRNQTFDFVMASSRQPCSPKIEVLELPWSYLLSLSIRKKKQTKTTIILIEIATAGHSKFREKCPPAIVQQSVEYKGQIEKLTGAPCRDVPKRYGNWNSIARCFHRWCQRGIWEAVATTSAALMADNGHHSIDSTTVRGHVSAAGGDPRYSHFHKDVNSFANVISAVVLFSENAVFRERF